MLNKTDYALSLQVKDNIYEDVPGFESLRSVLQQIQIDFIIFLTIYHMNS